MVNYDDFRFSRWWSAFSGITALFPYTMVDSGDQISDGPGDYYNIYKGMVENALIRPSEAEIKAFWWRTGDHVEFYIKLENLSDITLSAGDNLATLHAIIYEDAQINNTNRFSRVTTSKSIWDLAPRSSDIFTLETTDLPEDVNWEKLHYVVLVDYRPAGMENFDTLQAVIADPLTVPFEAQPDTLTFFIDPSDNSFPEALITLLSPFSAEWYANSNKSWLSVTPSSATIETQATISIERDQLSAGWQQGSVTFSNAGGDLSDQVLVNTFFGPVDRIYLPIVEK